MTVDFKSLDADLPVGSSILLYLEDDFSEPDSIPATSVYFVADSPRSQETSNGAQVYAARAAKIETGAYFDETKKDIRIRVLIPDMCATDSEICSGADGPERGQRLRMVIEDDSGIANPTESGTHSVIVEVLGPAGKPSTAAMVRARNDKLRDMDKAAKEMIPPGMGR